MEFENRDLWNGVYEITGCRRALSPSGLPGIDYALNPYGGCEHGCVYCYAPEVTHSEWSNWRVVRIRTDIASRLSREIGPLKGVIGIGTVTDPYQYAEKRFCLTGNCLDVISRSDMRVHIHTKSDLILRDADRISEMKGRVGITITGIDDRISKMTEPGAPLPQKRLDTLSGLVSAGIDCYALIGPVLDHLNGNEDEFVDAIVSTGVKRAVLDSLNPRPHLSERLDRMGLKGSQTAERRIAQLLLDSGMEVERAF